VRAEYIVYLCVFMGLIYFHDTHTQLQIVLVYTICQLVLPKYSRGERGGKGAIPPPYGDRHITHIQPHTAIHRVFLLYIFRGQRGRRGGKGTGGAGKQTNFCVPIP